MKGHHFILLFSPHVGELLTTLTLCVILCGATVVCKRLYPAHANDKLSREWD